MNKKEESTRESIILATIDCMEKEGLHSVTIRKIAKEAKVNVAAINYHFGSKKKLLDEVLKYTLNSAFVDWEEALERKDQDLHSILQYIGNDCLEGALRYPGITKAHFYDPFVRNNYHGRAMKRLNAFLALLKDKIKSSRPEEDEAKIELSVMQFISALFFPAIFPDIFRKFSGVDFRDPEYRQNYVIHLVETFFQER
jgi:AcrR family transcriptional regulator